MQTYTRTLGVGDIHGALISLDMALIECNYNPEKDRLIFLGDYVDGWSESSELVERLIQLKEQNPSIVFIRGNHDVWAQDWLNKGWSPYLWTQQGGQATIDSYIRTGYLVEQSHKDFFNNLVDWFIDENNNIYIHGGWDYKSDDFPQSAKFPVNAGSIAKECHWDRSLYFGAASASYSQHGFKATRPFNKVFVGHTSIRDGLPKKYCNLINLDTGCGWSGKLTIMDVYTEEYWQSDFSKKYYPNEKGR